MLRISAQLLALAMPVLGALAVYAIWLRVAEHGLSPNRIAAGLAALVVLGYGLLYTVAVLLRRDWTGRIRSANIVMALVVIMVSVLWLTPVLNAERMSARDLVARFAAGKVSAEKIDLWFIARKLGRAGPVAIAELAALDHPDADVLKARIARLDRSENEYAFLNEGQNRATDDVRDRLLTDLVVLPQGAVLPRGAFKEVPAFELSNWDRGCAQQTPGGRSGCVLVIADFLASRPGDEALLFWMSGPETAEVDVIWPTEAVPAPANQAVFLEGARVRTSRPPHWTRCRPVRIRLNRWKFLSLALGGARIVLQP